MIEVLRARCPQIQPLEVWNVKFKGGPSWKRLGALAVAESGRDGRSVAREALQFGRELEVGAPDLILCFAGGLTRLEGFRQFMNDFSSQAMVLSSDRKVLAGGGLILEGLGRGDDAALVADVGQTQIKIGVVDGGRVSGRVWRFDRPWDRLPVQDCGADDFPSTRLQDQHIDRLVEFVGQAIEKCLRETEIQVTTLILALPCELGEDLVPGPCSYGDWSQEPELLRRILDSIRAPLRSVIVLNDAELAGYAVLDRCSEQEDWRDCLVITLGFGPGAAYVRSEVVDG